MIEPVAVADIMRSVIAGASVVLFGAFYALFFALAKSDRGSNTMLAIAYGSYALLAASVLVLAKTLNLTGAWSVIVVVMLGGYLLAPHWIWHLCVATHIADEEQSGDSHG